VLIQSGDLERGLAPLRNAHSRAATSPVIRYCIAVALLELEPGEPFDGRPETAALFDSMQ